MHSNGREIISVHIGQAGIQMGTSLWEQYCKEHKIGLDGVRKEKRYRMMQKIRKNANNEWEAVTPPSNDKTQNGKNGGGDNNTNPSDAKDDDQDDISALPKSLQARINESSVFFSYNMANDTHCPRSLLFDLEPNVIDDVMSSAFGGLFNPNFSVKGKEDAANNYARGHYTVGAEELDKTAEIIRKNVECCDHVQAFLFNFAVGGGTGSGFGGLLADYLTTEYKKKPKISFAIYPAYQISTCVVEPYNALLATHDLIEHQNITMMLDNEAGYEICQTKLNIPKPSYFNINRLIAKVASSITAGLRFTGQQQFTINDMLTNLVPYPRLHFMTCGMGPIYSDKNDDVYAITSDNITVEAFRSDHMFTKYYDWDPAADRYMGISVIYRGNCSPKKANGSVQSLKSSNKVQLVDWCPTGFKISMIDKMPSYLGDDGLKPTDKSCVMIGNNVAVVRPFDRNIAHKYDLMYSQRSFVHWYVGEGMEEGEFAEAREDLEMLMKDYTDANGDQNNSDQVPTDDDDDDDDDNDNDNDNDDDNDDNNDD